MVPPRNSQNSDRLLKRFPQKSGGVSRREGYLDANGRMLRLISKDFKKRKSGKKAQYDHINVLAYWIDIQI